MRGLYLPPVTHVIPLATLRRERTLPVPGAVTVRMNEKVQAPDVIAEAEVSQRHLFLDLARGLGVTEREAGRLVARQVGERVEVGDVVGGPVGIARRTVRAPADGRVVAISRGRVLLEVYAEAFSLRAGFPGLVVATDGTRSVTIEATGALVQAAWGNGKQDYGLMRTVGSGPGDRMQTSQLDINLRGAILIGGMCDHPAPLHQATELSVRGVILGSMSSELIQAAMRLPYPLVLTEGFGEVPMNSAAYSLLTTNVGREAAILARPADPFSTQRTEVLIPLPSARQPDMPEEVIGLKPNIRVRVLRAPYQGATGLLRELPAKAVDFPSGILARSASVDLEGLGVRMVPLANLEVLQ
jgi:hypothetical protein